MEELKPLLENERVYIRRHYNDWSVGYVSQEEIEGLHWDTMSGGVGKSAMQAFIHGYVMCDCVRGEISHSCAHGEGPHRIKVVVIKKDNTKQIFDWAHSSAGEKPKKKVKGEQQAGNVLHTYTRGSMSIGGKPVSIPTLVSVPGIGTRKVSELPKQTLEALAEQFVSYGAAQMKRWKAIGADPSFIRRVVERLLKEAMKGYAEVD